jgi:peroxiredoxin
MSLDDELRQVDRMMAENLPADKLEREMGFLRRLAGKGIGAHSPVPGGMAPEFSLPNALGRTIALRSLRDRGPVVVSFYRGRWCVYCNTALRALQRSLPEIEELGGSLCAISPQTPDNSLTMREKAEIGFEVLSDAGNAVARQFGIVYEVTPDMRPMYDELAIRLPDFNGDESWELPSPATFIVGRDGRIVWRFIDANYTHRADPDDIIAELVRLKG